jgi:hypothetical protein
VVVHAESSQNGHRITSARQFRPPGSLRVSPIDPFKHVRELRR